MDQVKGVETHRTWKHVKSGKLYTLMGYGMYKGGVNEPANDLNEVIVVRPIGCNGFSDYDVVPAHYTISGAATADRGIMQTTKEIVHGDMLAIYHGDYYDQKDTAFARRVEDFFDGRFVKVDKNGNEIDENPKKIGPKLAAGRPEGPPPGPIDPPSPPPLKVG